MQAIKKGSYMKKIDKNRITTVEDALLPEYDFDFTKAKPNKYADILKAQDRLVQLEPDVFSVFDTSDKVNNALRSLINSLPKSKHVAL